VRFDLETGCLTGFKRSRTRQHCDLHGNTLPVALSFARIALARAPLPTMPRKRTPWAELGSVDAHHDGHCAHVRHRNEAGLLKQFRGPDRGDRRRAEADLEQMRAAAAVGNTREHGLEIMAAEARRIQLSAQFEAEVLAETQRQREAEAQEEALGFVSDEEPPDEPWLLDYPSPRAEEVGTTSPSQKAPLTQEEADVALQAFRPIKARPQDLQHILACRADPNKPVTATGDVSPFENIMCFAREHHVAEMRELLLQHGLRETDDDRARWVTRQSCDLYEQIRRRDAREDHRDYDPCGAAMEKNM
jgi:hypothetical protein